jgi:hypothetical protein
VLDQGVHIGQDRVGGAAVVSPGCAGRDPGVGDQPRQQAAEVCARCRVDWCHTWQASAVLAASTAASIGPALRSSGSRTAARMAGHRLKRVGASWTIG